MAREMSWLCRFGLHSASGRLHRPRERSWLCKFGLHSAQADLSDAVSLTCRRMYTHLHARV